MSLLINGMNMPKNGQITIELASEDTGTNIIARITNDKTGKLIGHEGVVVIPSSHGRLIDADKLSISILKAMNNGRFDSVIGLIEHQPTVIEAEE